MPYWSPKTPACSWHYERSIREAKPSDAEQLIAHVERLAEETDADIPLAPGEFNLTVGEERESLAGYAASDNSLFLVAEANSQGGRGKRIGTTLMGRAIEWAKSTGVVTRIELKVLVRNKIATHLYEKLNFQIEGRRQRAIYHNREYADDLIMALLL